MSLILPDREIDAALEGWYYTTTGYEYERALCQAQARHMAREILNWIDLNWTDELYAENNMDNLADWLRQEGVLG